MKKSTMQSLVNYLNGATLTNLDEIKAELEAELNKGAEKAAVNKALYERAKAVVLANMTDEEVTAAELYESVKDALPENFSRSKLSYGLNHYWSDVIDRKSNDKVYVYKKRS